MQAIINIHDPVMGSWHQITVEQPSNPLPNELDIRLDGTTLPADFETHRAVMLLVAAFNDDFSGIMDGLDTYLADLLAKREAEARERQV